MLPSNTATWWIELRSWKRVSRKWKFDARFWLSDQIMHLGRVTLGAGCWLCVLATMIGPEAGE
jgi:hypothetical protein